MLTASRPVMPWMMNVVSLVIRIDIDDLALHRLHLRHGAARGLVHRHAAVAVLDAVVLEDLEPLGLPRAGNAEDSDLLRRVETGFDDALDDAARHDVDAGVGDDVHHHGDLLHAGL